MSQAKLTNLLPLIREAACVVVENEINENEEYETKALAGKYTIKAIMSSAFSVGESYSMSHMA